MSPQRAAATSGVVRCFLFLFSVHWSGRWRTSVETRGEAVKQERERERELFLKGMKTPVCLFLLFTVAVKAKSFLFSLPLKRKEKSAMPS